MSTQRKKKSNKLGSSIIKRIWNEEEELAVLKEKTSREDEEVANAEPLNVNVAEETDFNDKITEIEGIGKESNENDIVADELCVVVDAYETLILQDLSSNEKKLQLEKMMKIGNGKRKELSKEWKELCAEKAKLKIKKLRLAVKLGEAVNES